MCLDGTRDVNLFLASPEVLVSLNSKKQLYTITREFVSK